MELYARVMTELLFACKLTSITQITSSYSRLSNACEENELNNPIHPQPEYPAVTARERNLGHEVMRIPLTNTFGDTCPCTNVFVRLKVGRRLGVGSIVPLNLANFRPECASFSVSLVCAYSYTSITILRVIKGFNVKLCRRKHIGPRRGAVRD